MNSKRTVLKCNVYSCNIEYLHVINSRDYCKLNEYVLYEMSIKVDDV